MHKWYILLFLLLSCFAYGQEGNMNKLKVYLIPGQGSDARVFSHLQFDESLDTINIPYLMPFKDESMTALAKRMASKIDTSSPFAIIGVSLGGMLAVEMGSFLQPEKVILISSASNKSELPKFYTFFNSFSFYKEIPAPIYKLSTGFLQPIFEPDRNKEKKLCNSMIKNKDAEFLKRAVSCIVTWQFTEEKSVLLPLIHIHGKSDNTLPIKNVRANYIIQGGSHMMALTRAKEISDIINNELVH